MNNDMITRHGEPSKHDQAPYGYLCKVTSTLADAYDLYIQLNEDDLDPKWHLIGSYSNNSDEQTIKLDIEKARNFRP